MNHPNISESFLQYVWKTLNFDCRKLQDNYGRKIKVLFPGFHNQDQGPDFLNAKLLINETAIEGDIELHLRHVSWYEHQHNLDPHYNKVVLHVIYDLSLSTVKRFDGTEIPETSLLGLVSDAVLDRYNQFNWQGGCIPCNKLLLEVPQNVTKEWLETLVTNRIDKRVKTFNLVLNNITQDWNQLIWFGLVGAFGGKLNKKAFQTLANQLPYNIVWRNVQHLHKIESLLFGVAGFLESKRPDDDYVSLLKEEWAFLSIKHKLKPIDPNIWLYSKTRPNNFPDVRLAQLAALIHRKPDLVSLLSNLDISLDIFSSVSASFAWDFRYRLGRVTNKPQPKRLTTDFANGVLVNCLVPLRILYQRTMLIESDVNDYFALLYALKPESNKIINAFKHKIKPQNLLESQALIELFEEYCTPKRCMKCAIGLYLISGSRVR